MKTEKIVDVAMVVLVVVLLIVDWNLAIKQGEKHLEFLFIVSGVFALIVLIRVAAWLWLRKKSNQKS